MSIRTLYKLLRNVATSLVFWIIFTSFTVATLPFGLFRRSLQYFIKKVHPDWGRMLSWRDAILWEDLQTEDELSSVMLFGVIAEGEPNLNKIRTFFSEYVLNYKNLRGQRPYAKFLHYHDTWLGFSFWRRARNARIEDHIRYLDEFPQATKEDLEKFLGEHQGKPFPRGCSPWEILVVRNYMEKAEENYENLQTPFAEKFVLIFRWHHTLGDATSIAKIFINVFAGETLEFLEQECVAGEKTSGGSSSGIWFRVSNQCKNFCRLGRDLVKALQRDNNIWRVSEDMLANSSHLVSTNKLPFNVARLVSKKQDVSVSSILYAAIAGGIQRYFLSTGQGRRVPENMKIQISSPLRKHPNHMLVNFWSMGNIALPVGEPEAILRLHKVEQVRKHAAESWLPSLMNLAKVLQSWLPNYFSRFNFKDKTSTMVGWNFPGPNEEILLLGEYPALEFLSYHPRLMTDAAIGLSILSYNGTIRFFLCVDQTLFPSRCAAVRLATLIEKEFLSLQAIGTDVSSTCDYEYEPGVNQP